MAIRVPRFPPLVSTNVRQDVIDFFDHSLDSSSPPTGKPRRNFLNQYSKRWVTWCARNRNPNEKIMDNDANGIGTEPSSVFPEIGLRP